MSARRYFRHEGILFSVEQSRASFCFWRFVHNALIHPLLAFPWSPRWVERAHDWTAERCYGAG